MQILLSSTQAGPGRKVKQEQEEISRNHVPRVFLGFVNVSRFDFLRKLQLFSRSICAPIRHEAVPRPLSFSDRSERPGGRGRSTMNNEWAKGQNIFGRERKERKEFPRSSLAARLIKNLRQIRFLESHGIVNIDYRVLSPLTLTQALLAKNCLVHVPSPCTTHRIMALRPPCQNTTRHFFRRQSFLSIFDIRQSARLRPCQ